MIVLGAVPSTASIVGLCFCIVAVVAFRSFNIARIFAQYFGSSGPTDLEYTCHAGVLRSDSGSRSTLVRKMSVDLLYTPGLSGADGVVGIVALL